MGLLEEATEAVETVLIPSRLVVVPGEVEDSEVPSLLGGEEPVLPSVVPSEGEEDAVASEAEDVVAATAILITLSTSSFAVSALKPSMGKDSPTGEVASKVIILSKTF